LSSITSTLRVARARTRRPVLSGDVRPLPSTRGYPQRTPGFRPGSPGARRGHRAPPRGVDVKATPPRPRDPVPGTPLGGLGGPWDPPGPRKGLLASQGVWETPGSRRTSARGGFYINPSRRGPVPGPGGLGPSGAEKSQNPHFGAPGPFSPEKGLFQPPPGVPPPDVKKGVTGPRREGLM